VSKTAHKPTPFPLPSLLELSAAQLEVALQNSNAQVERLAAAIAAFARMGAEMCAHADPVVAGHGERLTAEAQRAMFAMQFQDALAQRLTHVRDGLGDVHDALAAPVAPPVEVLLSAIRGRYTMEDERRLFDALVGKLPGAPSAHADSEHEALCSSSELF
jgi:hemoglobin-like flavoprotein